MEEQVIRLSVPPIARFARPVRMMAASLATVSSMSVDDVEDLRMAAEEGFVYACATAPSSVDIEFVVAEGSVRMGFALGTAEPDLEGDPALSYANLLLAALCDSYEVDASAHVLRLAKMGGDYA